MKSIGIVGLGLLGRGIATCLLSRGLYVVGVDVQAGVLKAAREHIASSLNEMLERRAISDQVLKEWEHHYVDGSEMGLIANCDFVIESVAEDLNTKRLVIAQLESILRPDVPIGSNTSALPITQLQAGGLHPERIVGMHWAEPCHLTRFLEVIRGEQTNDPTMDKALELGKLAGKDPTLVQKDVPGFIVNRLGYAIYREAFWMLEQGVADVETIDRSFRNAISVWANIAGPFRWMDLTGLPAYGAVMKNLFPVLSNQTEVPETMQKLMESGAKGIANGKGFYNYTPEEAKQWEQTLTENVWNGAALSPELQTRETGN